MAIGGDIGVTIDLSLLNTNLRSDILLFSESNTRWILEVKKDMRQVFEEIMQQTKTPSIQIGETKSNNVQITHNKTSLIDLKIDILRDNWKNTLWKLMG
jgi:phosphoribosylformylglycinamidine synthase